MVKKRFLSIILTVILALGVFVIPAAADFIADDWAIPELEAAESSGLIPDSLVGKDLKQEISRAEFAAVAVKLYENLSGVKATPAPANTFTDTSDAEVLKAFNVGITTGTGDGTTFSPDVLLNREQAATMLTRVVKAVYIKGWTIQTDSQFTLDFVQPAVFADDAQISSFAKSSVYFMASKGIILGKGGNMFAPSETAKREEALIISVRSTDKDKLDGAKLTYTTGDVPVTGPPTGSSSFSGSGPELKAGYTAAELAAIQADFEAIVQDHPTGGTKMTFDELDILLSPYYQGHVNGSVSYGKYISGDFEKNNGKWVVNREYGYITLYEDWWAMSTDEYSKSRFDRLSVADSYFKEDVGVVRCSISTEDADYNYYYSWNKGAKDGELSKYLKEPYDYDGDYGDDYKAPSVTRYPDAIVAGQECFVYSYYYEEIDYYVIYWFSKSKGFVILSQSFYSDNNAVNASFTFELGMKDASPDVFDPGKQGVTNWNEYSYDYDY